jgi:hypothetical protein
MAVLLLGGIGILTLAAPGVIDGLQRQGAVLVVAMGLVGYTAAIFVAAFGTRGPRRMGNWTAPPPS